MTKTEQLMRYDVKRQLDLLYKYKEKEVKYYWFVGLTFFGNINIFSSYTHDFLPTVVVLGTSVDLFPTFVLEVGM